MMSEKRFVLCKKGDVEYIEDNCCVQLYGFDVLCEMLNEQQEFIEELHISDNMGWERAEKFEKKCPKELHNKKMYIKRLEYKVQKFKEMNDEQQATIRRLQDLCGESDGENARLRIQNKKLKAQLREKEEDERLYANEILELRETNKEHIKFKSLGGDY